MGLRAGFVAVVFAGLLLACQGDGNTESTVSVTVGRTAARVGNQEASTVPSADAELHVDTSDEASTLTVRYGGRLAQERWPFAEVYRVLENESWLQVGWLVLDGDVGSFQPYRGRAIVRREETTHGGPGPETYPLIDLAPGDYQICAEVVSRGEVGEAICAGFSKSG
jgi:hypothetical protein